MLLRNGYIPAVTTIISCGTKEVTHPSFSFGSYHAVFDVGIFDYSLVRALRGTPLLRLYPVEKRRSCWTGPGIIRKAVQKEPIAGPCECRETLQSGCHCPDIRTHRLPRHPTADFRCSPTFRSLESLAHRVTVATVGITEIDDVQTSIRLVLGLHDDIIWFQIAMRNVLCVEECDGHTSTSCRRTLKYAAGLRLVREASAVYSGITTKAMLLPRGMTCITGMTWFGYRGSVADCRDIRSSNSRLFRIHFATRGLPGLERM